MLRHGDEQADALENDPRNKPVQRCQWLHDASDLKFVAIQ